MTKKSGKRIRVPSAAAKMDRHLKKYALRLGYVAFEWNQLQEEFGRIFETVLQAKHTYAASAIWHATQNDRTQRQILKRLLKKTCTIGRGEHYKNVVEEIVWAIDIVDNKYSDKRNNAIHTPMMFWGDEASFVPDYTFLNDRAVRMYDKDIFAEMENDRYCLNILYSFISDLHRLCYEDDTAQPLPERPVLPTIPQRPKE